MKSLFDKSSYNEIKNRVSNLTSEDTPTWGKMNVGQMVTHCQFPFEIALSDTPRKRSWNPLPLLFKKAMYSDKPWRKSLPTAPQMKITDERDLDSERIKLITMIDAFYARREQKEWQPHPMFGNFTKEQWGKMEYKHMDHHLVQFGV